VRVPSQIGGTSGKIRRCVSIHSSLLLFISIHTHDVEREHFGENGPDLSPFFVPIRSRLSLSFLSLSLSRARRDLSAPTMRALLFFSHSPFFSLINLPFLAQR